MEPSPPLKLFRDFVSTQTFKGWDRFVRLERFVKMSDEIQPVPISILTLRADGSRDTIIECEGKDGLEDFLTKSPLDSGACRLFLVENISPETIALLHDKFGVEHEVFAKHVENEPWFRSHKVEDCVTTLHSSRNRQKYLQIRHVETLSVYSEVEPATPPEPNVLDSSEDVTYDMPGGWYREAVVFTGYRQTGQFWRLPDRESARIPRPAEKFVRQTRPRTAGFSEVRFHPVLWARHVTTVWIDKTETGGWIGVVLLDPSFKATLTGDHGERYLLRAAESYECKLPSRTNGYPSPPRSSRRVIAESWQKLDEIQIRQALCDPFVMLYPIYSLVAHHWNIFNTFMDQEIHNTEFILEVTEPAFPALELHLKSLYAHRRRCTKYYEFLTELKEQCESRGQRSWNFGSRPPTSEISQELAKDFEELRSRIQIMETKIDKNIVLLAALVSIGGGKQSLDESKGITRLTLFATTFIPASTVATILGIEQPFSPGSSRFWIFGAVAVPLTIAAFAIVFIVSIKSWIVGFLGPRMSPSKKDKIPVSKV